MTKISVIVPVYNAEKYLYRCIDSILAQTFTDFELLLVNDGSKDNSGKICDEYAAKDSRVRVFHKENGGVSSARNVGLDNVKGEWVTFCDSDDSVEKCWLEFFIRNTKGVELVLQGFNNDIYLKDVSIFSYEGSVDELLKLLHRKSIVGYCYLKLFRTNIIQNNNIRFVEEVKFREDEDFVLKYLCSIHNVRCVKEGGYNYYIPDLSKKYIGNDNFPVLLSMYASVCCIYSKVLNDVSKSYLNELINAYFYSFNYGHVNCYKRTKILKAAVGKAVLDVNDLSIVSRYILYYCSSYLASKIFKIRTLISK